MIAAASGPVGFACALALAFAVLFIGAIVSLGRRAAALLFAILMIAALLLGATLTTQRAAETTINGPDDGKRR